MRDDIEQTRGESFDSIHSLIERFPLVQFLRERGFEGERGGSEWIGQCPHCQKKKLAVRVDLKRWHCWVCQKLETVLIEGSPRSRAVEGGGGLLKLLSWLDGLSRYDAIALLKARAEAIDPSQLSAELELAPIVPWRPAPLPAGVRAISPYAPLHPYDASKGLTAEDVQRYQLLEVPAEVASKYRDTLVYPVFDLNGAIIYWQARIRREALPGESFTKTLNPYRPNREQLGAGDVLFNAHQAGRFAARHVVLCEGPKSAIFAGPHAVASFGKSLSDTQAALLVRIASSVTILFDGPKRRQDGSITPEALSEAVRIGRRLAPYLPVRIGRLPYGDPADHPRFVAAAVVQQARPIQEFDLVA